MKVLKPWLLTTGNDFIQDSGKHYFRPQENPGSDFPFVQSDFNDIIARGENQLAIESE